MLCASLCQKSHFKLIGFNEYDFSGIYVYLIQTFELNILLLYYIFCYILYILIYFIIFELNILLHCSLYKLSCNHIQFFVYLY